MEKQQFRVRDKILVLRLNRLEYVPSGLYSSELLAEKHSLMAVEYGYFQTALAYESSAIPRLRLGHPWARRVPRPFRSLVLHSVAATRIAKRILREGHPRLILAEGLAEQTIAYFIHLLFRIPYAVHVHEVYDRKEVGGWNRLFLALEGLVLRRATLTIFPQVTRAQIYCSRYNLQTPTYIASNCPRRLKPFEPINWRARSGLPCDSKLLGYWGGQGRTNALEQAIRAVARTRDVYFLLWGWSSQKDREYFRRLAAGVGAGHRILFLGELPERKWSALGGLDAAYCVYEPRTLRLKHLACASNKLMEALAVGVPVLTSSEPDFREIVDTLDVGECAPNYTVEGISQSLRLLLADESRRRRQAANAMRAHQEIFNYETQFRPIQKALSALLGEEKPAPLGFGDAFPASAKM